MRRKAGDPAEEKEEVEEDVAADGEEDGEAADPEPEKEEEEEGKEGRGELDVALSRIPTRLGSDGNEERLSPRRRVTGSAEEEIGAGDGTSW